MATPRKGWFRVQDTILLECWTPELKGIAVNLMAYMNTRWARGGLTADEGCEALIPPAALMLITGTQRLLYARSRLAHLAGKLSVSVRYEGGDTLLRWPKLAEIQGWRTLELPESRPFLSAPAPAPAHAPSEEKTKTKIPSPSAPDSAPKPAESSTEPLPIRTLVVFPDGHPAWHSAKAAFADYGKPVRACGSARAKLAKARLKDHPDRGDVLAELVHGYIAFHDHHEPAFDPLKFLTPETVFGPSKTDKYLDAYDAKLESGARPPFRLEPQDPYAGHKTFAERDVENLKHNAVEVLERINVTRAELAERQASRRQFQTRVPNAPLPALAQRKLD